jgi:hypothetical protein
MKLIIENWRSFLEEARIPLPKLTPPDPLPKPIPGRPDMPGRKPSHQSDHPEQSGKPKTVKIDVDPENPDITRALEIADSDLPVRRLKGVEELLDIFKEVPENNQLALFQTVGSVIEKVESDPGIIISPRLQSKIDDFKRLKKERDDLESSPTVAQYANTLDMTETIENLESILESILGGKDLIK